MIGIPGKFERDLTEIDRLQDPDHSKCFAADNAIRRRSYQCLAETTARIEDCLRDYRAMVMAAATGKKADVAAE